MAGTRALAALILSVFAQCARSQTCGVAPIGPCFGTICPEDHKCLTNLDAPICCRTASIVPAATTTTAAPNCPDLNPSDCQKNAALCNSAVYFSLMTTQCPMTCGRCPGVVTTTTAAPTCPDLNPADCQKNANLCNNEVYFAMMTTQCPKTCGRCPGVVTATTATPKGCVDLLNPDTGVSDCPPNAYLCNDGVYFKLMTQQCPKTCARCSAGSNNNTNTNCMDLINSTTGFSDCPSRTNLCNDPVYISMMTEQCPRTCGRCRQ